MIAALIRTMWLFAGGSFSPRWADVPFESMQYDRQVLYIQRVTTASLLNWILLAVFVITTVVFLKLYLNKKSNLQQKMALLEMGKRELMETQDEKAAAEKKGKEELSRAITGLLRRFKTLFIPVDQDRIFRTALDLTRRGLHASTASILMIEDTSDSLIVSHSIGMKEFDRMSLMISLNQDNLLSWVVQKGVTIDIDEVMKDADLKNLAEDTPMDITLCGPIRIGKKVVGLLNVGRLEDGTYGSEEKAVFSSILAITSLAYERLLEQKEKV